MSLENAAVTKSIMLGCAVTSILGGIFDVKHYLHLQLVPHLSRHHQYWRLGVHHLAFSSSSDLLIAELILFNIGVHVERRFGSVKFASFALVSTLLGTLLEFIALLVLHRIGLNHIALGPAAFVFSLLYQYYRIVPSAYTFRVFGLPLSNKSFTYVLALQMAISRPPGSIAVAIIGAITGQIYPYRLPPSTVRFAQRFVRPVIGSLRPPRRSNRALPDDAHAPSDAAGPGALHADGETTDQSTGPSVVTQWVNELTGRRTGPSQGIRVASEAEIAQVVGIFPDVQRETVVHVLQASPNAEAAIEILLRR
ncbi:hypothetical protein BD779DRAFT_1714303 [Infundibulicybe gibba]|nr:hypothetical protein BD779DRAFT_1714303 [Infundibulicybe gibba]